MAFLIEAANRGSISTEPYEIENSLKFESDNVESLTKSQTASNRKTWTISFWFKRTKINSALQYVFEAGLSGSTLFSGPIIKGTEYWIIYDYISGSRKLAFYSTAPLNDPSAWYHMVIACDTTQSIATDRFKIYLNGVNLTAIPGHFSTAQYPDQDYESNINWSSSSLSIGKAPTASTNFNGYISDFNFIDGLMKQASDFGEFDSASGIWKPKEYTGSYGNEGYFLNFQDSSNLGADSSGNGNNFTQNNITSIDQATDTPTNTFCTINNLVDQNFATWSLTEGGTKGAYVAGYCGMVGTMAVSSGKWYWEGVTTSFSGTNYWQWGVIPIDAKQGNSVDSMGDAGTAWYSGDNAFYTSTSQSTNSPTYDTGYTSAGGYTAGDVWSISLNCDVSPYEMTFRINNSVPGTVANNTNRSVGTYTSARPVFPYIRLYPIASANTWHNFGNPFIATLSGGNTDENGYGDFKYTPPSGYYALCSKNLAEFG
jgi:hypothetical protein